MGKLVDMRPEKDLIVNALIKDATLETAIFEFIDNSIKAAKKISKNGRIDSFFIKINMGKNEEIEIIDNCGGMDKESFINKVFRFGNSYDTKDEGYGIGMKRALFKLAEKFEVISYGDNGNFKVCLDVKEWLKNDNWNASMEEIKVSETNIKKGVQIRIDKINVNIKQILRDEVVIVDLTKKVKEKYFFALKENFKIEINNNIVKIPIKDARRKIYESPTNVIGGNEFKIVIEKSNVAIKEWGWNFIVGGRIVSKDYTYIEKNLKEDTNEYEFKNRFIGNIFIEAVDVSKIPIKTTKDALDKDSRDYKKYLSYMEKAIQVTKKEFFIEEKNIAYKKSIKEINKLKQVFKVTSNAEVGRKSFEMALKSFERG